MSRCDCVARHVDHDPTVPGACLRAAVEMADRCAALEARADAELELERRHVRSAA